tara:strand:+ start:803 stop:1075 length:273 start_codon:yes stop_codon:yes gene_type:complete
MEIQIITKEDVKDMILATLSEEMSPTLWCENNSLRADIKDLQEQILNLQSTVNQLKKITGWNTGYDDHGHDVPKSLERQISDLRYEVTYR